MIDALPTMEYNKISNSLLGDCVIEKILVRQLGANTESPILLNAFPINTQRARNTLRGLQARLKKLQCLTL